MYNLWMKMNRQNVISEKSIEGIKIKLVAKDQTLTFESKKDNYIETNRETQKETA